MTLSSHRIRSEEKKVVRKIILTLSILFGIIIISLYVGLPLLARVIILLASVGGGKSTTTNSTAFSEILFPPTFNPFYEATNSAKIILSGFTQPDTTVKIIINDTKEIKVNPEKGGEFIIKNITLKEGSNTIVAYTLKDNKTSESTSPLTITYKKEPPKLEITAPRDGDKYEGDEKETTITGETDPENKVTVNDRMVIVNYAGKFSYTTSLSNGNNEYKIVSKDNAGNITTQELTISYSP